MGKLFAILVIVAIGWYAQQNYDFSGLKKDAVESFKKEKTINAVNTKRSDEQQRIYDVTK